MATDSRSVKIKSKSFPGVSGLVCLACLFILSGPTQAAEMKDSLQGLTGIYVSIQGVTQTLESFGLTAKGIRERVERTLREAGVQVLTEQEWLKTPDRPCLSIYLRTYRYPGSANEGGVLTAFSVEVRFFQAVSVPRNPAIRVMAPTWSLEPALGVTREKNLGLIQDFVTQFVGRFVNDYASVNAAPPPGPGARPLQPPSRPGVGEAGPPP